MYLLYFLCISDSDDESLVPFEIETVNDTPSETETTDDTDMFSSLGSPSRTSSLDSDTTEEPVIETVDETDMFADLWSRSRTSSLDLDVTEEPVIEAVDDTDIFAYFRSPSRAPSLDPDETEVYPSIQSGGTRTVIEESLNVIREYEVIRDGAIMIIEGRSTLDEPRDFVVRSSRWDRLPSFSDCEISLTRPVGQDGRIEPHSAVEFDIVSVSSSHEFGFEVFNDVDNNNTTVSSTTNTSDVPMSRKDEMDFLHTRVAEEKLTPKWDNITDDARSRLGASGSGSSESDVESQSLDIQVLLRQALKDLNHIYHINENWEPRKCNFFPYHKVVWVCFRAYPSPKVDNFCFLLIVPLDEKRVKCEKKRI